MKLAYDLYLPATDEDCTRPPVILLHGRLSSRKTWKPFAPEISQKTGRKVYALDARNHGESPWSSEMDFDILANDVDQFMDDHGIPKAILVGHSMGGRTAITLALQKPERVEQLFVEDMVVESYSSTARDTVAQAIALLRKSLSVIPPGADEDTARKCVDEVLKKFLPPGSSNARFVDNMVLQKVGSEYRWQANLDVLEDMLKNRSSQKLSGVYNGDTLFLYGSESFFEVEKDESISRYFPRAVKVCVEGTGHLIHQDRPDVFLAELLKFI